MDDPIPPVPPSPQVEPLWLDEWVVPPPIKRPRLTRRRGRGSSKALEPFVHAFCNYQLRYRGKGPRGVEGYRWTLLRFGVFVRATTGRTARIADLSAEQIQAWMEEMGTAGLAVSTIRTRQVAMSSLCRWLCRQHVLSSNPVDEL